MANRIYRGPTERQPITVSDKTVAGAYLPGTFVTEGASTFTQATAFAANLLLLADRDYYTTGWNTSTSPLLTAYASGDGANAYELEPGQIYQCAMAAATYTFGQELTVAASGRLAAASSGNTVVAFAHGSGAKSAGDLMDVKVTSFYTKA